MTARVVSFAKLNLLCDQVAEELFDSLGMVW